MSRGLFLAAVLVMGSATTACSSDGGSAQAVCALVDTSGTYVEQVAGAARVLKLGVLPRLRPGDTLVVARIDSDSYQRENIVGLTTLDARPSRANRQKLAFAARLDELVRKPGRARHTDITGGLMLCREHLDETGAGHRAIVVFSDLQEELPKGAVRDLGEGELTDTEVFALNVKRLKKDNLDPSRYRQRLDAWGEVVQAHGAARWEVVQDGARLADLLAEAR